MFLFVFENVGTSELLLIGIVALIFLGPRRLPEIAKKMGKFMADFRATTHEFKSTWEREVSFEEEERMMRSGDPATPETVPQTGAITETPAFGPEPPEIRSIDREAFERLAPAAVGQSQDAEPAADNGSETARDELSDKRSWL